VQRLLDGGATVKRTTPDGSSALHAAAEGGHEAVVKQLLANNADVNVKTSNGYTPLHAANKGRSKALLLLLDQGADIHVKTKVGGVCGHTPLHLAASGISGWWSEKHTIAVDILLSKGADVDAKTTSGETPLHIAACGGARPRLDLGFTWRAVRVLTRE